MCLYVDFAPSNLGSQTVRTCLWGDSGARGGVLGGVIGQQYVYAFIPLLHPYTNLSQKCMHFEVVPFLWNFICIFTGIWALIIQLRYQSAVQAGYLSPSKSLYYRFVQFFGSMNMWHACNCSRRAPVFVVKFLRRGCRICVYGDLSGVPAKHGDTRAPNLAHHSVPTVDVFPVCTGYLAGAPPICSSIITHGCIYVVAFLFLSDM